MENNSIITDRTIRGIVLVAVSGFILYKAADVLPLFFLNDGGEGGINSPALAVAVQLGCFALWGFIAFRLLLNKKAN